MNNELYERWMNLYQKAKDNMQPKEDHRGILIEVAAQHPLIDGDKPNEEFRKRLDLALQIYKERSKTEDVFFYVPGSLHMDNGVSDEISLSLAGKRYLMEHRIDESKIYSDETNLFYKGEKGVYNSTDECFVASQIFKDNKFKELHSVCGSMQMMRKTLSYISFGYFPFMHVVSCKEMYHNPIDEIFKYIPILLEDKDALQGNSDEADRLRKLRNPNL